MNNNLNNSNNDLNNAFDNEVQIDNNPTSESSNIANNNVNESTSIPPVQTTSNVSSESQNINNTEENKTIDNNKIETSNVNVSNTSTKNNKKNNITIPILSCVLVLVIVFGFGYYFIGNKSNKTSNDSTEIKKEEKKSEYRITSNSLENFDLYFLQLENNEKNMVYSPLSIKYALEMLEEGASGETKEQISNIIGDYEAKKYINSENMSFANAMFIRNTFKDSIKEDYTNSIRNKFNGEVVFDSFDSASTINNWVKEKTLNLLDNLVDDDSVKDLDFALINALAIDMEWEHKFLEPITFAVMYPHEKIKKNENNVYIGWMAESSVRNNQFQNVDGYVSGMKINASFNRYDIIKELGEDNIKQTVLSEFKKYVKENSNNGCYESQLCNGKKYGDLSDEQINEVFDDYFKNYIKSLEENYNKSGYNTDFELYVDDDVKVFAKDLKEYNGTTLQYVGIMPTNVGLKDYINDLNSDKLNNIINNLKELKLESFKDGVLTRIIGFIPKFKFDYTLDLTNDLKTLGVSSVFEQGKADLSNLTSNKKEFISYMTHKANIEFTEDGIKASAATMAGGAGAAGAFDYLFEIPVEIIDLTFDKPYMYIIRDKNTGEVWFVGSVYEPLNWELEQNKW